MRSTHYPKNERSSPLEKLSQHYFSGSGCKQCSNYFLLIFLFLQIHNISIIFLKVYTMTTARFTVFSEERGRYRFASRCIKTMDDSSCPDQITFNRARRRNILIIFPFRKERFAEDKIITKKFRAIRTHFHRPSGVRRSAGSGFLISGFVIIS